MKTTTGKDLARRPLLSAALGAAIANLGRFANADTPSRATVSVLNHPALMLRIFDDVFFICVQHAGNRLLAGGLHGVIVYSDDNGASWTQAKVPVDVTITCIDFATPELGWAAGHFGVILATRDGGKSWALQLDGMQVNEIALDNAKTMTAQPPPANASPALELASMRAQRFEGLGPDKPFLTMLAQSPERVMVFGAYRMAMVSSNGGKSWDDLSLAIYDRLSNNLYDVAVIGQDIYIAGETGLVFRSIDAGASFPQVTPAADATLFGLIGAADGSVIAFGVAGTCARSTDQGQSWKPVNVPTEDDLVAARLLPSGELLLARGAGGLFMSRDNGASFIPAPAFPQMAISDFAIAANGALVFVGWGMPKVLSLNMLFPAG